LVGTPGMLHFIRQHDEAGVFTPEEITILAAALDEAWERLLESGAWLDSERRKEEARNILGKLIIQAALQGERDVQRLREGALLNYAKSKLRER
jgi:hypothetical protein